MPSRILVGLVVVTALALGACGGTSSSDSSAPEKTHTPKPKPKFDNKAYAKKLEKTFVADLGKPIKKACDAEITRWQCFYDGITAKSKSWIVVNMSTPGDVSQDEAKDFSKQARLAWFNFLGLDNKDLDTVVTMVNGRDTGTTYRRDVPLLNR